jgi:hypothetical protein
MVPPLSQLGGDLSRFFGHGMLLAEQTKNAHHAACPIFAWMTGNPEMIPGGGLPTTFDTEPMSQLSGLGRRQPISDTLYAG